MDLWLHFYSIPRIVPTSGLYISQCSICDVAVSGEVERDTESLLCTTKFLYCHQKCIYITGTKVECPVVCGMQGMCRIFAWQLSYS